MVAFRRPEISPLAVRSVLSSCILSRRYDFFLSPQSIIKIWGAGGCLLCQRPRLPSPAPLNEFPTTLHPSPYVFVSMQVFGYYFSYYCIWVHVCIFASPVPFSRMSPPTVKKVAYDVPPVWESRCLCSGVNPRPV